MLDAAPDGATTSADANDVAVTTVVDARMRFVAIGTDLNGGHNVQGFWFPGSEGEVTYRGNTYPGGQLHMWRRRYHPLTNGLTQRYRLELRFSREESFPTYIRHTWRWAARELHPPILRQELSRTRRDLVDMLASVVEVHEGWAGIPNALLARAAQPERQNPNAIMGFCGKNLEAAEYLLADASSDTDKARAGLHRNLGLKIFDSFVKLKVNPPIGEGFNLDTGESALAIPYSHAVFLRSFTDDMKAVLQAFQAEKLQGHYHPEWLAWAKGFGDWLLSQQTAGGGYPRSWEPGTGKVLDTSTESSFEAIPLFVLLGQETADPRYVEAAVRTGDFVWKHGQSSGQFVGGTIDNPDVLDKEAGTLSIEAYLSLYVATQDPKWLAKAQVAADYAETYIYLWNVPMPADADSRFLHWKPGVPTYGTQLIATGHSLVDEYMANDVPEYAELGRLTHDAHYSWISELLFYDTKGMIATSDHLYDLRGPGWSQEHFSFAPVRGKGLHQLWLPWVATTQLRGIFAARAPTS